jgi:hypothetical protein
MKETRVQRGTSLGFGIVLVALGFLFLLGQWVDVSFLGAAWPLIIITAGLVFFVGMATGGKAAGGLAIPGSIITTVGLILLYQNTFNHYESWAYTWALIPMAVGIGTMICGHWSGQAEEIEKGRRVAGIGALMFLIGFAFFEFVIGVGGFGPQLFGGIVGPLLLVGFGVYLVFRNLSRSRTQPNHAQPGPTQPEPLQARPATEEELWTKVSTLPPTATHPPTTAQPPVGNGKESVSREKV